MEKGPLKLKLKLGSTPEPPAMETEPIVPLLTDDEEDEELIGEDGNTQTMATDDSRDRQHKKAKKKKKKKERERHKHKRDRTQQDDDEQDEPSRKLARDAGSSDAPPSSAAVAAALMDLLTYLLKQLEKKDTNQFFIEPVTDLIAPGYSSVISQPMCFVTMRDKVAKGLYTTLHQYESDVKLMVNNCLKYNGADTVYSSAGKKLLAAAQSVLSREKLLAIRKEVPAVAILPPSALGFPLIAGVGEGGDSGGDDRTDSPNSHDSRSDDDDDTDTEAARVTEQAQQAAKQAAAKLHSRHNKARMGYLKPRPDGTIGLSFLSGCEGGADIKRGDSKPLNLGLVLGKLSTGSAVLNNYHDDKRTMAKPVKPIVYGSFSSFCPSYDSTFANLSKDESELVRATYGNDTAVQYAESICDFSRDCSMATTLVDQLLNLLTSGQHTRTRTNIAAAHHHQMMIHQHRLEQQKQEDKKDVLKVASSDLRSLSALGIDMTFLDTIEHMHGSGVSTELQSTGELVQSLAAEQSNRLTKQSSQATLTPSHPSQAEIQLADRLTSELVSVARQLPPSALLPAPLPHILGALPPT